MIDHKLKYYVTIIYSMSCCKKRQKQNVECNRCLNILHRDIQSTNYTKKKPFLICKTIIKILFNLLFSLIHTSQRIYYFWVKFLPTLKKILPLLSRISIAALKE